MEDALAGLSKGLNKRVRRTCPLMQALSALHALHL